MKLEYKDTFKPTYSGKLFTVTPAQVEYDIDIDLDGSSPEGKELAKYIEAMWKKQMAEWKVAKEKEYGSAITETEKRLIKHAMTAGKKGEIKNPQNWLAEEVKGANVMIKNALLTLEAIVPKKAEELIGKARDAVAKKVKKDLRNMKIKAGLKILGHVVLIVAAGALAVLAAAAGVAVTVFTMGAGAVTFAAIVPVVTASLTAAIKSGMSIRDTVAKEWPSVQKASQAVEKNVKELITAVEYEAKKADKDKNLLKLGPKEKIKRFLNNSTIKSKKAAVHTSMTTLESFNVKLLVKIDNYAKEVGEMEVKLAEAKEKAKSVPAAEKEATAQAQKVGALKHKIYKARKDLEKLTPISQEAKKVFDDTNVENVTMMKGFLGKIQAFLSNDSVQSVATEGKDVISGGVSVITAFTKALG